MTRHHLVVLAPGATPADRRRLGIRSAAPACAAGSALVAFVVSTSVTGPLAGVGFATAVFAAVLLSLRRTDAAAGPGHRQLHVVIGLRREPLPSRDVHRRLLAVAAEMEEASVALRREEIDAVEFELRWGRAWAALPREGDAASVDDDCP